MKLNPYLSFDGNGMEAAKYYAETLDGEIVSSMTFGEIPESQSWITDENRDRLANAIVQVGDNTIMLSDTAGQEPHQGYAGVTLQMSVDTVDEGQDLFAKISAGGEVRMPFGETFWAKGFGMCLDKYGVSWMVNCD